MDQALTAKDKAAVRDALAGVADYRAFRKDGTLVARRTYFYRHGMTAPDFAMNCQQAVAKDGRFRAVVVAQDDCFHVWPKTSFFRAELRVEVAR